MGRERERLTSTTDVKSRASRNPRMYIRSSSGKCQSKQSRPPPKPPYVLLTTVPSSSSHIVGSTSSSHLCGAAAIGADSRRPVGDSDLTAQPKRQKPKNQLPIFQLGDNGQSLGENCKLTRRDDRARVHPGSGGTTGSVRGGSTTATQTGRCEEFCE